MDILEQIKKYGGWIRDGKALLEIQKDLRKKKDITFIKRKMMEIIEARTTPSILAEAGEILGRLGDDRNLKVFVKVAGGEYIIETFDNKKIDDFELGKYLVTNCWYKEFMEARGYENKEYWIEQGWKWITKNSIGEPSFWNTRRWNCPNAPVVGVSWFEAVAFTNWLTGIRDDGYTYRLPTEFEWQAAAAGQKGNTYPWGNVWGEDRCNNAELGLERTTSVGVFVSGNTPKNDPDKIGVLTDMAGNVWEWTSSYYGIGLGPHMIRGGSWNNNRINCRCVTRGRNDLFNRFNCLGFRVARTRL